MKKSLCLLLSIILIFSISTSVYAQTFNSFDVVDISDSQYYITLKVLYSPHNDKTTYSGYKLSDYGAVISKATLNGKYLVGDGKWENSDYIIKTGEQTVNYMVYDAVSNKTITCKVYINGIDKVDIPDDSNMNSKANTPSETLSLTATNLSLSADTTYNINLKNKVSGSTYLWTSSNTKVAKVNSKNGKVTAVNNGTAEITCDVTKADGSTEKLSTDVTVGSDDDNTPSLTDSTLDLETGDTFDLDVDNNISGSKNKWTSSDTSVAKVSSGSGKVTAISKGNCQIICTITNGTEVTVLKCDVEVSK